LKNIALPVEIRWKSDITEEDVKWEEVPNNVARNEVAMIQDSLDDAIAIALWRITVLPRLIIRKKNIILKVPLGATN
jgi:hypothetical protein